jgi:hypothetical protein
VSVLRLSVYSYSRKPISAYPRVDPPRVRKGNGYGTYIEMVKSRQTDEKFKTNGRAFPLGATVGCVQRPLQNAKGLLVVEFL